MRFFRVLLEEQAKKKNKVELECLNVWTSNQFHKYNALQKGNISGKAGMDSKKNAQNYYHKQVNGFALTFGHNAKEDDVY